MAAKKIPVEDLLKALGANDVAQAVTQFIDTGYPPLNRIISGMVDGGLPFGRLGEMFGPSSSGKTAIATEWMIAAQKMGGVAIFIDWERSFDVDMAESMGLNVKMPYWIYKRPRTWEEGNIQAAQACEIIRESGAIPDSSPIFVVLDSIASAIPKSAAGKKIDEMSMNDTTALSRVTSTTLKNMAQIAADYNATFLYLNQIRTKIGVMFGDPTTTPGGAAMEFYSTFRLQLSRTKVMQETGKGDEKEMIGQDINIKCVKSKLTAPFKSCTLRLAFDDVSGMASFDKIRSLVDVLSKAGVIKTVGWVDWNGKRFNGKKALIEGIREAGEYNLLTDIFSDLVNNIEKKETAS